MKKYDAYKPSGIDWIGKIPKRWKIMKTSWVFKIGSGTTPKSGDTRYYTEDGGYNWLQTGDLNDGVIIETSKHITEQAIQDYNLKFYSEGSLIIALYGATIGKVGILGIKTTVNQACCVLNKSRSMAEKYAFYVFQAGKSALLREAYGGGQPNISQDIISTQKYPFPPLSEQKTIAEYLDAKCAKIDKVVAVQQKRIELLKELKQSIITRAVTKGLDKTAKMKDSGIDWIGKVPERWEVKKTLYCLEMPITDGPHESPVLFEDGIPFISAEAISNGYIDFNQKRGYISKEYYDECCKKYIPRKSDIYMIKSGATTGRCAIVDTDETFTIWSPLAVFRADKSIITPKYLLYVLRSEYYQNQVEISWSYGTQQNIGMRDLEKLKIAVPALLEQNTIVTYLDTKCAIIDKQIAKVEKQIDLLNEYKQSVITECVTGKRKVY